jgi:hypothetical protein
MYGRGSSDDKGPVLGWINVLEAIKGSGGKVPVNLVFCLEGMEESGSEGLDDLIEREKDGWFKGVDCVCISGKRGREASIWQQPLTPHLEQTTTASRCHLQTPYAADLCPPAYRAQHYPTMRHLGSSRR